MIIVFCDLLGSEAAGPGSMLVACSNRSLRANSGGESSTTTAQKINGTHCVPDPQSQPKKNTNELHQFQKTPMAFISSAPDHPHRFLRSRMIKYLTYWLKYQVSPEIFKTLSFRVAFKHVPTLGMYKSFLDHPLENTSSCAFCSLGLKVEGYPCPYMEPPSMRNSGTCREFFPHTCQTTLIFEFGF